MPTGPGTMNVFVSTIDIRGHKTYEEPGRAQDVLRKARQRGLKVDVIVEKLVGTKRADWLLNGGDK